MARILHTPLIGAIVGFWLVYGGEDVVVWDKIGFIVLSWFVSLVAGILSFILFKIYQICIYHKMYSEIQREFIHINFYCILHQFIIYNL